MLIRLETQEILMIKNYRIYTIVEYDYAFVKRPKFNGQLPVLYFESAVGIYRCSRLNKQ